MKKYSDLVYRDLKRNKTRGVYTILGVILGIVLLTSILSINNIFKRSRIEDVKKYYGDYEIVITNLSKDDVKSVSSNIKVKNYGRTYLEEEGRINENNYSIVAIDNEGIKNILSSRVVLRKGEYPKKAKEIILEKNTANVLLKDINDKVVFNENEYRVVGIYEVEYSNIYDLSGIVYFEEDVDRPINMLINIKDEGSVKKKINAFIKNDKYLYIERGVSLTEEEIRELDRRVIRVNDNLVEAKMDIEGILEGGFSEEKLGLFLVNTVIIILTIILIYSSINISLKEKVRSFSLLRCLGATEGKIKYLLFKESIIIGFLSIIPGIILGNILSYIIVLVIYKDVNIDFIIGNNLGAFNTNIRALIISAITIFLGVIVPVLRGDKVNLIESVKGSRYKNSIKKRRKNKIVRKIFGYKGELAYKNIRGNGRSFFLTVSILSLIIIVFTGFSAYYLGITKEYERDIIRNLDYEARLDLPYEAREFSAREVAEYVTEKGEELEGIIGKKVVERIDTVLDGDVNKSAINGGNIDNMLEFVVLDDDGFRQIEKNIKGKITLEEFKNNGVIAINGRDVRSTLNIGYKPIYSFSKEEEVSITVKKDDKDVDFNLTYQGEIDGLYIQRYKYAENNMKSAFIISKDTFLKNEEVFKANDVGFIGTYDLSFNIDNDKELEDVKRFSTINNIFLIDHKGNAIEYKKTLFSLSIIINTILLLSLSIATLNIINNKIIDLALRDGEIATFISLGMRVKDIKKVIILEGVIEFLYSSIIGGGISLVILKVLDIIFKVWGEVPMGYFPIHILLIGIGILFVVSIVSSIISLKVLKKKELSKVMRGEEYI